MEINLTNYKKAIESQLMELSYQYEWDDFLTLKDCDLIEHLPIEEGEQAIKSPVVMLELREIYDTVYGECYSEFVDNCEYTLDSGFQEACLCMEARNVNQ